MPKKPELSPAQQLLELVWENTPRGSWPRLNSAMRDAMNLAIDAGLAFDCDDFAVAMQLFGGHHWFDSEGFYARACLANLSAAQAFETWKDRPPFIADNVDGLKRARLAVGSRFPWRGRHVTVTSFADKGKRLTACEYADGGRKVSRRHKITVAAIREERSERRERVRLLDRGNKVVGSGVHAGAIDAIRARCGFASKKEWFAAPLDTLRALVAEMEREVT